MKHLRVDDIINFVSLTELGPEAIELSVAVNGHIRNCDKCRKCVRAFQMVYDTFTSRDAGGNFRHFVEEITDETSTREEALELRATLEALDNSR